mmetsp:Transcript_27524/g.31823  ORF Transcript_27524/g.31823 Transcript_27524/m.31823 type:complete len:112 (-) Transcript_27524:61-396(-)
MAKNQKKHLTPEYILFTLFTSNMIGIVFCRSIHYQFYSWYFHTIPYLLLIDGSHNFVLGAMRILILAGIEYAYNIFPATPLSSAILQICHLLILLWVIAFAKFPKIVVSSP